MASSLQFLHVLNKSIEEITFEFEKRVKHIVRFDSKEEVKFKKSGKKVTFGVPANNADIVTTVEVIWKK